MKPQNQITTDASKPEVSKKDANDDYKACPYCGQNAIPFKLGVCICGNQVGKIQYVKNSKTFTKNYYSYIVHAETPIINEFVNR